MGTTTINADLVRIVSEQYPDTSWTADELTENATGDSYLKLALARFSYPSTLAYRPITATKIKFYCSPRTSSGIVKNFDGYISLLTSAFDASVTYNTKPGRRKRTKISGYSTAKYVSANPFGKAEAANLLSNGVAFEVLVGSLSTSLSQNPICVELTHADADDYGYVTGNPNGGYIPKTGQTTFRWSYTPPSDILGTLGVSSCRFAYRKSTSGAFTFVNCGSNLFYTSTAGMFSDTDTVQWYPEVTLSNGAVLVPVTGSGTAIVYTLTTVEPALSAQGVSPSGTIEDGSQPITFTWNAWNSVGSSPSGADLQYSTDSGTTWTTLGSVSGSATTYAAAANTLPGGELSWRVRAINGDNVAGDWSAALRFINVAAPAAPSVSSDAAPFATITWDATGQQAYEVKIDGVSYGIHFGTEKTFSLPLPLTDGNHTAEVRVQGQYSLWSQPGSVTFTVANSAAGTIDLAGDFGVDAQLLWDASPAGTDYLIFRDGVQIGHTANNEFTDRRSLGTHVWYVLLRQADGSYTKSNDVTGTLTAESPLIAPLAGGPWIALRLTESSTTTQTFSYEKTHTLRHYSGSPFPVIELTPYEDFSGAISCAFADADEARAFEALRGQVVILKIRGAVLIGGLMNLDKAQNPLYVAYQFTINQIAVEEIVDD